MSAPAASRSLLRALFSLLTFVSMAVVAAPVSLPHCALESWNAEHYHAYVFHRRPLDPADQELVDVLASAPAKLGVNLLVATVDVDETMEPATENLWLAQSNPEPPWMVVQSPSSAVSNSAIWSTALRTPSIGAVLTSPARQRITEHLMDGHAAVWLLVESGDPVRDEVAIDTLTATLRAFEKSRSPPRPTPGAKSGAVAPPPLHFSVVRVTRDDSAEEFLLKSLVPALAPSPMPAAYPIFGRGRTLPPLVGRRLNEEAIVQACQRVLSQCTNDLRETSRGSELLLGANWQSSTPLSGTPAHSTNSPSSLTTTMADNPSGTDTGEPQASAPTSSTGTIDLGWLGGFAAATVLAALAGFAIVRVWRSK